MEEKNKHCKRRMVEDDIIARNDLKKKKIQNMKTEELAKWLHNNYEEISKKKNWNTQKLCKVEFENLPKENKSVMLSLARRIHKNLR